MPLRVVVIVEGHGEDDAIRPLFERIWYSHLQCADHMEVLKPWRVSQGQLLSQEGLKRAIDIAAIKLHAPGPDNLRRLLVIMVDTEGDAKNCPITKAPELLRWAKIARSDTEIACVMPNVMFETWFAAAAESLRGHNGLPDDLAKPDDPEGQRLGKSWVKKHLPRKYKETVDQAKFACAMSLTECHENSRSFRKLVKVLREQVPPPEPTSNETAPLDE